MKYFVFIVLAWSVTKSANLGVVIRWFVNNNKGLMSSIVVSGYGFGSAIWIPIETKFVNPDNIDAVPIDPNDEQSDKYEAILL